MLRVWYPTDSNAGSRTARYWEHAVERSQAIWLRRMGIDDLVAEGREYWEQHRAAPDLTAFEMQSRTTESAALLDPTGLGAFTVLEWVVDES